MLTTIKYEIEFLPVGNSEKYEAVKLNPVLKEICRFINVNSECKFLEME